MNLSGSERISNSLLEIFIACFFGLLWGFSIWWAGALLMLAIGLGFMGNTNGLLNWGSLGWAVISIVISPILLLLIRTRSWIRGLAGGVLANLVSGVVFVLLSMSQILASLPVNSDTLTTLQITVSSAIVILTVILFSLRSVTPNDFMKLILSLIFGSVLAIMNGYFLEQRLLELKVKLSADPMPYTFLTIPALIWLYSIFFMKVFSGVHDRIEIISMVVLILVLTCITCGLPFISDNLLLYYLSNLHL